MIKINTQGNWPTISKKQLPNIKLPLRTSRDVHLLAHGLCINLEELRYMPACGSSKISFCILYIWDATLIDNVLDTFLKKQGLKTFKFDSNICALSRWVTVPQDSKASITRTEKLRPVMMLSNVIHKVWYFFSCRESLFLTEALENCGKTEKKSIVIS